MTTQRAPKTWVDTPEEEAIIEASDLNGGIRDPIADLITRTTPPNKAESIAGTDNDSMMTPLRTKEVIEDRGLPRIFTGTNANPPNGLAVGDWYVQLAS